MEFREVKITKDNISNKMQAWREDHVKFTSSDLDDLLFYLQWEVHAKDLNTALDILPLIFRESENKKIQNMIQPIFDRIKEDMQKNEKIIVSLLNILIKNETITEEQYTSLIEIFSK